MLHISTQLLLANSMHSGSGHSAGQKKSEEGRKGQKHNIPPAKLDLGVPSAKNLPTKSDASFFSSPRPYAQKFNVPPMATPISTTSAIFDSPQKSSPSSSISSTNPLTVVLRTSTPLAELEDTSPAYICPELEDTSYNAIRSGGNRSFSSFTVRSTNPTARSLISAVDQQFADYEAEIRFLRRSLTDAEKSLRALSKSLCDAMEAANDSRHALDVAQETISDRDYEIEIKKNVIEGLEKDVKHCQEHHLPPIPPSKQRESEGPVSRFNIDANRSPKFIESKDIATMLSPSFIGRPFAAGPNSKPECSSTMHTPKTARPTYRATSSNSPSPANGGSPYSKPHHHSRGSKPGASKSLAIEALATAISSAASPSKPLSQATSCQISDVSHARKPSLEQPLVMESNRHIDPTARKPQHRSRRAMQSSASNPNLRYAQNLLHISDAPDMPTAIPVMSGGLGILESSLSESQERRPCMKRGALGAMLGG